MGRSAASVRGDNFHIERQGMFQVRIHGRGGQGVVTGAEMLSIAAFQGGRHAQEFPSFGSERTGAPVVAFCRIDDREIRLREPIMQPDALIIQDATLLHQVDVFSGLKKDGFILINTTRTFEQLGLGEFVKDFHPAHLLTVPASELAMKHVRRPVPNVPLLGAFAALGAIALEDAEVCVMPFDQVEELSREFTTLQHHVHKIMSREIVRDHSVMLLLGSMRADERLAAFLLNLAQRLHARGFSQSELVLRMTREEIGSYLGMKLETVSRTFSKFVEDGIIEVKQRYVHIKNTEALKLIVNATSCR